ncbi:S9 family peptidase [Foetidibacter luteolus]|uniref:S9 family peptidase n=1 Tax=Foetidibacter luteolus TaxID=2608880 RepID=UPI00129A46EB|nr:S9 family peptidase [Foetidibacter luteolus]
MKKTLLSGMALLIAGISFSQTKRALTPADIYRLQSVANPQVSPDGNWVAYTLTSVDTAKDKRNRDIWMVSWDGSQTVQLTSSPGNEGSQQWSPDGKYLSFIAKRGDDDEEKYSQVYLLDRRGGEAKKLTNVKGEINDYAWSPDGKKILLVIKDLDQSDTAKSKIRTPYVIDRYHFKQDYQGYLDRRATHLYLFDVSSKKLDTLTRGIYDEGNPAFSPDGSQVAFSANHTEDPDRNENVDIYVMNALPGAAPKKLTTWEGTDDNPVWSPDGKQIAYLQSSSSEAFNMYGHSYAAVINVAGGEPVLLTKSADRPVRNLRWNKDGKSLLLLMEDDRRNNIASVEVATGKLTPVTSGDKSFSELECNKTAANWVALLSTPEMPAELYAVENGATRRLTYVQDSFLAPLQLGKVEGFQSKSKDGTLVSGLLYLPPNAVAGQKLPLVMFIHGGPVGQDEFEFDFARQVYAAAGYAVAAVNYRGSSGRGVDYIKSIYGDWGNKEIIDIHGAADYLVKQGIADGNRLGIAGWSYGGISTNYAIATDNRFKAAVSGAGSAMQLSMYGVDQYVTQYDTELGAPWKNTDKWLKLSYPFLHADRIKTPTMFMASENDFNVPVAGAEQMYQALKNNGVPTELIIYPNQNHGISVPSYQKDRYERHIKWFNKYLRL